MATVETVGQVLDLLITTRPGSRVQNSDRLVKAYAVILEPVSDRVLWQAAMIAARQKGEFLPSAGTLFELALDLMDSAPTAEEAWPQVLKVAQGSADLDSLPRRAQRVVERIGGIEGWTEEEIGFKRAAFIKAYEAERRRERRAISMRTPPLGKESRGSLPRSAVQAVDSPGKDEQRCLI